MSQQPDLSISHPLDWHDTEVSDLAELDNALRCDICKEFVTAPVITGCGHTFCSLCIRRVLVTKRQCPTCRKETSESQLRRNASVELCLEAFTKVRAKLIEKLSIKETDKKQQEKQTQVEPSVLSTTASLQPTLAPLQQEQEQSMQYPVTLKIPKNSLASRAQPTVSDSSNEQPLPEEKSDYAACPVCCKVLPIREIQTTHIAVCLSNATSPIQQKSASTNANDPFKNFFTGAKSPHRLIAQTILETAPATLSVNGSGSAHTSLPVDNSIPPSLRTRSHSQSPSPGLQTATATTTTTTTVTAGNSSANASSWPVFRSTRSQTSYDMKKKLPRPINASITLSKLRNRVKSLGIAVNGFDKAELIRRETEWITIWNANADRKNALPRSALLTMFAEWEDMERARKAQQEVSVAASLAKAIRTHSKEATPEDTKQVDFESPTPGQQSATASPLPKKKASRKLKRKRGAGVSVEPPLEPFIPQDFKNLNRDLYSRSHNVLYKELTAQARASLKKRKLEAQGKENRVDAGVRVDADVNGTVAQPS